MKKTIFAAFAAATLLLVGCNNNNKTEAVGDNNASTEQSGEERSKRINPSDDIAYISMDSLMMKFDLAIELRAEFEAKMKKAENQINSRGRKLEKDVAEYQEKASKRLLTSSQMAETEENLGKQQQQLQQLSESLSNELAEEETVMNNRIYHFIMDYLNEYNKDFKYSMIMSTSAAGPILHADPSLNITNEILDGLNAKYVEERKNEQNKK